MNRVVIPAYRRPEMLQLCLEKIQQADTWNDYQYIFMLDHGHDYRNNHVIADFPATHKHIHKQPRYKYSTITKQSYNVLYGLLMAASSNEGLVYLIEDDIMIGKDYFTMMADIHAREPEIICAIGTKNHRNFAHDPENSNAYYISRNGDYQSHAPCWKSKAIMDYLQPQFNKAYLNTPREYIQATFPDSFIGFSFIEQDGLIRRVCFRDKLAVAFPHKPRAFNAGFYGMNRGNYLRWDYKKKLDYIRSVCFDAEQMRKLSGDCWQESIPVPLNTEHSDCVFVMSNSGFSGMAFIASSVGTSIGFVVITGFAVCVTDFNVST